MLIMRARPIIAQSINSTQKKNGIAVVKKGDVEDETKTHRRTGG